MVTYNEIYLETRRKLRAAGITAHDLEARLLVAYAAGKTREELLKLSRLYVTDQSLVKCVDDMVSRRLGGEPVAYIVGEWEFYGVPITVNESVLIPRVDTELLAGEAIRLMKRRAGQTRLVDLCAGSGCIGLAVAANVPSCRVVLADNSDQALVICRANMRRNNLSRNVAAIVADALDPPPTLLGMFDAIVCNPPYIPTGELKDLEPSVAEYEPLAALDGGPDGLYYFRAVTTNWLVLLKQGGHLAFECGAGQSDAVREILRDGGLRNIKTLVDTLGIERVVVGEMK
ncbi:MAG: peptide chain release factor N(5)-glutamine methyltransferase [Oscillospiraceae bacterium]|nr:peptide chain release factor N(5)-glutamine methyltransferase [Oscillospiraceae bacterium]